MNYRSDLAVENQEMAEKNGERIGEKLKGVTKKVENIDENISVITVEITDDDGEMALGKPKGTYVTIESYDIEENEVVKEKTSKILAKSIDGFIPFNPDRKTMVIGLGNEKVTADSLGPFTVSKVRITSHLFKFFDYDGQGLLTDVSGFTPSVTGVTGMETAEVIKSLVELEKPDVVFVIDSLASKSIERVSTTIQLSDTGISPGAGMGNRRKEISEKALGCKVISIGVPTVIDSRTLIMEAAEELDMANENALQEYFETRKMDMVVTSSYIDQHIKDFSDIISKGINIYLHPGIYS